MKKKHLCRKKESSRGTKGIETGVRENASVNRCNQKLKPQKEVMRGERGGRERGNS